MYWNAWWLGDPSFLETTIYPLVNLHLRGSMCRARTTYWWTPLHQCAWTLDTADFDPKQCQPGLFYWMPPNLWDPKINRFQYILNQWEFQEPKMEVPTIYKAYIKQGILEFPLTKARFLSLFSIEYSLCWTKLCKQRGLLSGPVFIKPVS